MEAGWIIGMAVMVAFAGFAHKIWLRGAIPENAVVSIFDKNKYSGIWYVVARVPTGIENPLRNMTEEYTLNEDGTMGVISRAYHSEKDILMQTTGRIKSGSSKTTGKLKVAWYLPIYLDYNVLDIDENYRYALVSGSNSFSLSVLSRGTDVPKYIKIRFLEKAAVLGFDIQQLEWMDA